MTSRPLVSIIGMAEQLRKDPRSSCVVYDRILVVKTSRTSVVLVLPFWQFYPLISHHSKKEVEVVLRTTTKNGCLQVPQ